MALDQDTEIWFGDLCLNTRDRELRGRLRAVRLDRRACDVLETLIACRNRALPREEILDRVWPGAGVAPGSVTVQVHALREAFRLAGCRGESILTFRAPARYQLCLEVTEARVAAPPANPAPPVEPAAPIPVQSEPARPQRLVLLAWLGGIVLLGVCAGLVAAVRASLLPSSPPPNSIAVEPFADPTDGRGTSHLDAELTRQVIVDLAALPFISIAAGASAAALAGRPPQAIGQALHVRYVLEGSLTEAATRLRVSYALIDSMTGVEADGSSFLVPDGEVAEAGRLIVRRVSARLRSAR